MSVCVGGFWCERWSVCPRARGGRRVGDRSLCAQGHLPALLREELHLSHVWIRPSLMPESPGSSLVVRPERGKGGMR